MYDGKTSMECGFEFAAAMAETSTLSPPIYEAIEARSVIAATIRIGAAYDR